MSTIDSFEAKHSQCGNNIDCALLLQMILHSYELDRRAILFGFKNQIQQTGMA